MRILMAAALALLGAAGPAAAQKPRTFAGTITDDMCAKADHSRMRMGSTDAECTNACVDAHGAAHVLYDGKTTFRLTGGPPLATFAGQKVQIAGTLDAKTGTIHIESIAPAK